MSYLAFIKEELGDKFPIIVEELGYLGSNPEPNILTIRNFVGTNYKNSLVIPIQLSVMTDDVESTMEILTNFAKKNTAQVISSGLDYIKQNYATPRLDQAFIDNGRSIVNILSLNGTLTITNDIVDIEKILIDGEEVYFDTVQEDYVAISDSPKKTDVWLHKTTIRGGVNKIQISSLQKNSLLLQKIRRIKAGSDGDVVFNVEVHYYDGTIPITYIMKLDSNTVITSSGNIPFSTIALTE